MIVLFVKKADAWLKQTCLAIVLMRSILRWKNYTRAEALVQFFPCENRTN